MTQDIRVWWLIQFSIQKLSAWLEKKEWCTDIWRRKEEQYRISSWEGKRCVRRYIVKFPRQVVTQHISVLRRRHCLQSPLELIGSSPCLGCSVLWIINISTHGTGVAPSSSVPISGSLWLANKDVTFDSVPEFLDFSALLILDIGICSLSLHPLVPRYTVPSIFMAINFLDSVFHQAAIIIWHNQVANNDSLFSRERCS